MLYKGNCWEIPIVFQLRTFFGALQASQQVQNGPIHAMTFHGHDLSPCDLERQRVKSGPSTFATFCSKIRWSFQKCKRGTSRCISKIYGQHITVTQTLDS